MCRPQQQRAAGLLLSAQETDRQQASAVSINGAAAAWRSAAANASSVTFTADVQG